MHGLLVPVPGMAQRRGCCMGISGSPGRRGGSLGPTERNWRPPARQPRGDAATVAREASSSRGTRCPELSLCSVSSWDPPCQPHALCVCLAGRRLRPRQRTPGSGAGVLKAVWHAISLPCREPGNILGAGRCFRSECCQRFPPVQILWGLL